MKTRKIPKAKLMPQMGGRPGKKIKAAEVPMMKGMPKMRGKKK
jgi:hypothetical protein